MNSPFSMKLMSSRAPHQLRRGNTLVLVIGILVLLVIIATAYVTRTQAGRLTATAQQASELRDDSIDTIADGFAQMLADQLFVNPIDTSGLVPGAIPNAMTPRLGILPNAVRYGRDLQDINGDTYPDFPWNRASYSVNPHTNWPDPDGSIAMPFNLWPPGPGNLGGPTSGILSAEGNEIGWPGFGDGRIFRDLEPLRYTTGYNSTPVNDAPSHYRHLSYLGTIDNGWRICSDISDIFDSDGNGYGLIVRDLNVPCEQWLAIRPPNLNPTTGTAFFRPLAFMNEWFKWFGLAGQGNNPPNGLPGYQSIYADPANIPNNYYRLKDLDGDGIYHEPLAANLPPLERPQDEFARNSARWNVSRILADTDGDGFTDSFWWLSPMPVQNGIRQVVAVSVIDNCGMINVNVAGQFLRDNVFNDPIKRKTRGWGPFDLAMAGQMADLGLSSGNPAPLRNNWNVGLLDNPDHQYRVASAIPGNNPNPGDYYGSFGFDTSFNGGQTKPWQRYLREVGYPSNQIPLFGPPDRPDTAMRLDFWQRCSSQPLSTDTTSLYRPFNLDSEIELRMFAGANYPWVLSRFEHAVQTLQDPNGGSFEMAQRFLRSGLGHEENSEIRDQRSGREFLVDSRHRMTTYSAARNDIAPPWLWPLDRWVDLDGPTGSLMSGDLNGDAAVDGIDDLIFMLSSRKFDLRMNAGTQLAGNFDGNLLGTLQLGPATHRNVGIVLRDLLMRSMIDPLIVPSARWSYYGSAPTDIANSEKLAAAMAANIDQGRDADALSPIEEAVAVTNTTDRAFIGMERQPFLVEAFIGHVYKAKIAQFDHPTGIVAGQFVICAGTAESSTIVVVQVANPFDTSIDLSNFRLRVFDQSASLSVAPGMLAPNSAMTFYSIEPNMNGDLDPSAPAPAKWVEALKLDLPFANAIAVPAGSWSQERSTYDSGNDRRAIELTRIDPSGVDVIVDRIDVRSTDDFQFGEAVADDLEVAAPQGTCVEPPANDPWDALPIGKSNWVQWVRVTRGWEWDINGNGSIEADELNPRFIFPDRQLDLSSLNGLEYDYLDPVTAWFPQPATFESRVKGTPPVSVVGNQFPDPAYDRLRFPLQMLQKDGPFDQVGEVLNVWMYGHQLRVSNQNPMTLDTSGSDGGTEQTFTEYLAENPFALPGNPSHFKLVGHDARINRLRTTPVNLDFDPGTPVTAAPNAGMVIGYDPVGNYFDPRHAGPAMPAAVRMLDGFVCDGLGFNPTDLDGDGFVTARDAPSNAKNFNGTATPGLININTAPYEVMQAIPHWYRLVHETGTSRFDNSPTYILPPGIPGSPLALVSSTPDPNARMPRSVIPEAIVQYRERYDGSAGGTGYPFGPNYSGRGNPQTDPLAFLASMRCGRGIESIGEIALLTQPGQDTIGESPSAPAWPIIPQQWRVDLDMMPRYDQTTGTQIVGSGFVPFVDAGGNPESVRISTDDTNPRIGSPAVEQPDDVALDAEEMNLLFASASNMITTRSDTFTVYFRVRSFRQNTSVSPPVWDATNPEYIIDDSRYVMLVDRSTVNKPGDKPKILYMEKLPN